MSEIPPVYGEFGQALAFAERSLTAVLREHLSHRDITPETWYALKLVASRGPGLDREALVRDLEGSPNLDTDSTVELLARLEADGLITGDTHVDLTDEGRAAFDDLRAYIAGPTVKLLSQFDLRDIETTVRTMQAITRLATEEVSPAA
jgi:DNA-binding MarR family transcriptional regulator